MCVVVIVFVGDIGIADEGFGAALLSMSVWCLFVSGKKSFSDLGFVCAVACLF